MVISLTPRLHLLVEQIDGPLRRIRNRNIEPDMIVFADLADLFIVFLAQRDLLKVFDDAI
jgi:hypothetical protein